MEVVERGLHSWLFLSLDERQRSVPKCSGYKHTDALARRSVFTAWLRGGWDAGVSPFSERHENPDRVRRGPEPLHPLGRGRLPTPPPPRPLGLSAPPARRHSAPTPGFHFSESRDSSRPPVARPCVPPSAPQTGRCGHWSRPGLRAQGRKVPPLPSGGSRAREGGRRDNRSHHAPRGSHLGSPGWRRHRGPGTSVSLSFPSCESRMTLTLPSQNSGDRG